MKRIVGTNESIGISRTTPADNKMLHFIGTRREDGEKMRLVIVATGQGLERRDQKKVTLLVAIDVV